MSTAYNGNKISEDIENVVIEGFMNAPFTKFIGAKIVSRSFEEVILEIKPREEMYGNPYKKALHGGVLSSKIDIAANIMCLQVLLSMYSNDQQNEMIQRMRGLVTVNMSLDYLKPPRHPLYKIVANPVSVGKRIIVCAINIFGDDNHLCTARVTSIY